jgi:isopropylmalate/homocitrate/citramalate synthase
MIKKIPIEKIIETQQIVKAKFELRPNEFTAYDADNLFLKENGIDDVGFLPREIIAHQLESFKVKELAMLHVLFNLMSSKEPFHVNLDEVQVDQETSNRVFSIERNGVFQYSVPWFLGLDHILELYQSGQCSFDLDFSSFYN